MVNARGIEINLDQIKTTADIKAPINGKELMGLNGKIAVLDRFISRSTNKCIPFFNLLKKHVIFEWTIEC